MAEVRAQGRRWNVAALACQAAIWLFAMCAMAGGAEEPTKPSLEYSVKAAFLLNFTKFVDFPPDAFDSAASPLAICVLGDDPFDGALDQVVEGDVVNGRKVTVERLQRPPRPKSCQVLFIAKQEKEVPEILHALGPGVLTVSDRAGFLRQGGMIEFTVDSGRVRFDINRRAATEASLVLSARLLSVARSVR